MNARRALTEGGSLVQDKVALETSRGAGTVGGGELWLAAQPNPASISTQFAFGLPQGANVSLVIRDVTGRNVRTLESGYRAAGEHRVSWDLRDNAGHAVSTGLYFVSLRSGDQVINRTVLTVR